jgi:hypothetical protein
MGPSPQVIAVEVRMSGRRGQHRYGVTNADGSLRTVRDVTIRGGSENEFVAISEEPAAAGEILTLERVVEGKPVVSRVVVIDSRLVMVRGSVRYRLRLKVSELAERQDDPEADEPVSRIG